MRRLLQIVKVQGHCFKKLCKINTAILSNAFDGNTLDLITGMFFKMILLWLYRLVMQL